MDTSEDGLPTGERLQKALARAGVGSRRVCENLIADERVLVNGTIAVLGARVTEADEITVDGSVISTKVDAVTYLLNKPKGTVTTAADTHDRQIVLDLVPSEPRVFPVGRLDLDTEGLLLLTNDGPLAHRLTHPSFGVEKEYLAHVRGRPNRAAVRALREGVQLDDGMTAPAKASIVAPGLLRLTIHEGRNRQVRRMCEAIGHPVVRLARTRIGPLSDSRLKPGTWRPLTTDELLALQRAVTAADDAPGADEAATPAEPIGSEAAEASDPAPGPDTGTDTETE
ncbi:MAG: pseudouridine synthase [Actinomycetota bacterium]